MSDDQPISPREFLRQRRPERFSDTRANAAPRLDRSALEYHLNTLTSRSQETDFQNFALHLAERVVCPNLRPQTGPTGGGDSKADAETYPVAEVLSEAWYEGGRERIGFRAVGLRLQHTEEVENQGRVRYCQNRQNYTWLHTSFLR